MELIIWDICTGNKIMTLPTNSEKKLGMAMSIRFITPKSEIFVACTFEDGSLYIWNLTHPSQPIICRKSCFTDPGLLKSSYY